jgi:hypothetical protein
MKLADGRTVEIVGGNDTHIFYIDPRTPQRIGFLPREGVGR